MSRADGGTAVAPAAGRARFVVGWSARLRAGRCPGYGPLVGVLLLVFGTPLWAGEARLHVSPGGQVKAAWLIERESRATYPLTEASPVNEGAEVWGKTGLPVGLYDVILLLHRGRIEGVALEPEGVSADAPALRERDVREIRRLVMGMTSLADRRRILFLSGRGDEARVLVEELTTRKTSLPSAQPFVIWRVEVWYYRKEFGAWDRYDSEVIARERPTVADFEKTTWVFEPKLGGVRLSAEASGVEVTYQLPTSFDPATGLVASKDQQSKKSETE